MGSINNGRKKHYSPKMPRRRAEEGLVNEASRAKEFGGNTLKKIRKEKVTERESTREVIVEEKRIWMNSIERLTEIEEELQEGRGITLMEAIKEKCPDIALQLAVFVLKKIVR